MTLQIGEVAKDRYRIVQILASGGMGIVYLARDESLGVEVAIKESIPGGMTGEQMRKNASLLGSLHHPAIPRITDTFTLADGAQILVMDYIPGEDLKQRVEKSGPLKMGEAVDIILTIGSALQYLHTQTPPIIHQDVKPGNIRIRPDRSVTLVDFDLITTVRDNQTQPSTYEQGLTPGFAAPEQYNRMADTASDQYGLAATLFFALTGSVLPDGLTRASGNSQLPERMAARIPLDILTCLQKALQINPEDRYPNIQSFLDALGSVIKTQPEVSTLTTRKQRYTRPAAGSNSILTIAAISFGVIFVLAAAILLWISLSGPAPKPTLAIQASVTIPAVLSTLPESVAKQPEPTREVTGIMYGTPTALIVEQKPTPLGGGSGVFAFVAEKSEVPQICLGSTASSKIEQLTEISEGACQPDWSPDGKRIVFISPCPPKAKTVGKTDPYSGAGLFILVLENKQVIPIPSLPGGDFDPAWSPDGRQIVFTSLRSKTPQIYLYDVQSEQTSQLTKTTGGNRQPAWSPDAKQIAFSSMRTGTWQIWTMDSDGQNPRVFSNQNSGAGFTPDWSPDAKSIIFSQTNSLLLSIKKAGAANTADQIINNRLTFAANPDISPDNRWILFDSNLGGTHQVYRISLEGSGAEPLTPDNEKSYQPVWKPLSGN